MTLKELISAMRDAASKATPGPWEVDATVVHDKEYGINGVRHVDRGDGWEVITRHNNHGGSSGTNLVCTPAHGHSTDRGQDACNNMGFIAISNPENITRLLDALQIAEDALEFYAAEKNLFGKFKIMDEWVTSVSIDRGKIARTALQQINGDET